MLRILSRPSLILINDALQVWCRLANHVNIYTADPCKQTFVETNYFNSSLRRLSSRSQQTRKFNIKVCRFFRSFIKVLRELRIDCFEDFKEFPNKFCLSCLVGAALVGFFKKGSTTNAVDKTFDTLRITDRIHKTLDFMMRQLTIEGDWIHTFAHTSPLRLYAIKMIGRVVCSSTG